MDTRWMTASIAGGAVLGAGIGGAAYYLASSKKAPHRPPSSTVRIEEVEEEDEEKSPASVQKRAYEELKEKVSAAKEAEITPKKAEETPKEIESTQEVDWVREDEAKMTLVKESEDSSAAVIRNLKHVGMDTDLLEMIRAIGRFYMHNPPAFKTMAEMTDRLMDLQILIYNPNIPAKARYSGKASWYRTQAKEASKQLSKDTCNDLGRKPIQVPDLTDNIEWVHKKLDDMAYNISMEVKKRLDDDRHTFVDQ